MGMKKKKKKKKNEKNEKGKRKRKRKDCCSKYFPEISKEDIFWVIKRDYQNYP
jgi:hypothetical protein